MKKTTIIGLLAGLVALAVAVPAVGDHSQGKGKGHRGERPAQAMGNHLAKRACQIERKEIGREAFREKYGDEHKNGKFLHAMRNCKRTNDNGIVGAFREAVEDCRAERAENPEAFREKYGTNPNGKNAFGKCVSSSLKNAAKECKAERKENPEAFEEEYGTNENGRNAFGKCVSQKVKEDESNGEPTV